MPNKTNEHTWMISTIVLENGNVVIIICCSECQAASEEALEIVRNELMMNATVTDTIQ